MPDLQASNAMNLYFPISVLVLAGLLFFPVYRLVLALSVRRLEKRIEKKLNDDELAGQKRRSQVITSVIVIMFSLLFNLRLVDTTYG